MEYQYGSLIAEVHNLFGRRAAVCYFLVPSRAKDKIMIWIFESRV